MARISAHRRGVMVFQSNSTEAKEMRSPWRVPPNAAALRRGTIRAVQASLQPLEARKAAQQKPSSLPERLAQRRLTRALESRLPGLAERLRQHADSIARFARAGAAFVERLAARARRKTPPRQTELQYWRKVAARAAPMPKQAEVWAEARKPRQRR